MQSFGNSDVFGWDSRESGRLCWRGGRVAVGAATARGRSSLPTGDNYRTLCAASPPPAFPCPEFALGFRRIFPGLGSVLPLVGDEGAVHPLTMLSTYILVCGELVPGLGLGSMRSQLCSQVPGSACFGGWAGRRSWRWGDEGGFPTTWPCSEDLSSGFSTSDHQASACVSTTQDSVRATQCLNAIC